jgi:bacterioferritin-associated ferredoxin
MYACICRGLTEGEVRRAGSMGVLDPADLIQHFALDDRDVCCGHCIDRIGDFVEIALDGAAAELARLDHMLVAEHRHARRASAA